MSCAVGKEKVEEFQLDLTLLCSDLADGHSSYFDSLGAEQTTSTRWNAYLSTDGRKFYMYFRS
jgi:hypothetical protein